MLEEFSYPFKRQNYYKGKQLTAQKLLNEQNYMNQKRRLISTYLQGYGVVCGLKVTKSTTDCIKLQNGLAMDAMGREIVVPTNETYKLMAISGYRETLENNLYLGITYKEALTGEVYAPMCREAELNQMIDDEIQEGYELVIAPASEVEKPKADLEAYVEEKLIYSDESVSVKQFTPYYASLYEGLKLKVQLTNVSTSEMKYTLGYDLDLKDFRTLTGERYLQVGFDHVKLGPGETALKIYELQPALNKEAKVLMKVSKGSFYIYRQCNRENFLYEDLCFEIQVSQKSTWDWLNEIDLAKSLDEKQQSRKQAKIWLAAIEIAREGEQLTIQQLVNLPFEQYFYKQNLFYLQTQLQTYYPNLSFPMEKPSHPSSHDWPHFGEDFSATGILIIPGDLPLGQVYFTEWMSHRLGLGSVYMAIGVEVSEEEEMTGENSCMTIIGESGLFNTYPKEKLKYAIKIDHEKGRFQIAIQFIERGSTGNLRLRWYAIKMF